METKQELYKKLESIYTNKVENVFNPLIKKVIGQDWGVSRITYKSVTFSVINNDTKDNRKFVFGQDIEIVRTEGWHENDPVKYETNIGSCGSCDIRDGNVSGSRAAYYVGVGKLLSNEQTIQLIVNQLDDIDNAVKFYNKKAEEV